MDVLTPVYETRFRSPPKTYQDTNLPRRNQEETLVILTPVVQAPCVFLKKVSLNASALKEWSQTQHPKQAALSRILVIQTRVGVTLCAFHRKGDHSASAQKVLCQTQPQRYNAL